MEILRRLLGQKPAPDEVLNRGLAMAMEFGSNWLQPIQERLRKYCKELKEDELDEYNAVCQQAMRQGHAFIYDTLDDIAKKHQTIAEAELKQQFTSYLTTLYPWVYQNNVNHLFSQSCYYAWRDGLDKVITN